MCATEILHIYLLFFVYYRQYKICKNFHCRFQVFKLRNPHVDSLVEKSSVSKSF